MAIAGPSHRLQVMVSRRSVYVSEVDFENRVHKFVPEE
jgi:hypothetical protein